MIDWIVENWDNIFKYIGYAVTACTAIVKFTPTTKDDNIASKLVKIADWASVINTPENKAKLEKATKKSK